MHTCRNLRLGAALLALAGCAREERRPAPVILSLGLDLDRTGSIATPTWIDSIELAVRDANRGLALAGRADLMFATVSADSANSPHAARANAVELARKRGVKAILTDTSQDQIAVEMLAYDNDPAHDLQVPIVCVACTSPQIGDPAATDPDPIRQAALRNSRGWGFRTSLSDGYQSRVLARLLVGEDAPASKRRARPFRLAIYASDDPYGRGFAAALEKDVRALRPAASVRVSFHPTDVNPPAYDWAGDVARVLGSRGRRSFRPDAVVEMTFPQYSAAFTRAYLSARTRTRLVHTHNFRSLRVLESLGPLIEGQEGTSQALVGATPSAAAFAAELEEATGSKPAFRDAVAYDAAMSVLLAALVATHDLADPARVPGAAIRDALHHISAGERIGVGPREFQRAVALAAAGKPFDYDGASGPCDFDASGNVVAQVAHFRVQSQEFVDVAEFDCGRSPECPPLSAPPPAKPR